MASTELDALYAETYSLDLEKLVINPGSLDMQKVNAEFVRAQREEHDKILYKLADLPLPQTQPYFGDFDSDGSQNAVPLLCPAFFPELFSTALKTTQDRLQKGDIFQIPENCATLTTEALLDVLDKKGCLKQSETPRVRPQN